MRHTSNHSYDFGGRMKITVKQRGASSSKLAMMEEAARFYIAELLNGHDTSGHTLTISIKKLSKNDGTGYYTLDNNSHTHYITLSSKRLLVTQLSTLAHEMVHLKQFITGRLSITGDGVPCWYGVPSGHLDFRARPWEAEAYHYQRALGIKFINSCDSGLLKRNK